MERLSRRGETSNDNGDNLGKTDARKQSVYFPGEMLQSMKEEAARLDRSLSWVVQRAWKLAKADLAKLPSAGDTGGEEATDSLEGDE